MQWQHNYSYALTQLNHLFFFLLWSTLSKVTNILTVRFEIPCRDLAFRNSENFPHKKSEADLCLHVHCSLQQWSSSEARLHLNPVTMCWFDSQSNADSFQRELNWNFVFRCEPTYREVRFEPIAASSGGFIPWSWCWNLAQETRLEVFRNKFKVHVVLQKYCSGYRNLSTNFFSQLICSYYTDLFANAAIA